MRLRSRESVKVAHVNSAASFAAVVITAMLVVFAALEGAFVISAAADHAGTLGMDFDIYQARTLSWLAKDGFYLQRQVEGPYPVNIFPGPALYPPVLLYLTVPFALGLPAVLWWVFPIGVIAAAWRRIHPPLVTWPLLAALLCYPRTWLILLYGNPALWAFAALAAGLAWGWPMAMAFLKPTLGPFALVGIRHRPWWIGATVFAALAIPLAPLWPDYVTALANARDAYGLEYLIGDWPIAGVFLLAGALGRSAPLPSVPAPTASLAAIVDRGPSGEGG